MIIVKSPPGLSSEAPCIHHRLLDRVRAIAGFAEGLIIHRLGDREIYVNADQVHELKRSHSKPPLKSDNPVDFFEGRDDLLYKLKLLAVKRTGEHVTANIG